MSKVPKLRFLRATRGAAARVGLAAALSLASLAALAQGDDKSIVPEAVPAFPAFSQWVGTVVRVQPAAPVVQVEAVPFTLAPASAEQVYQPLPVILGLPELPLLGAGAAQGGSTWAPTLNYQGMLVQLVVLDASGARQELRAMDKPLRAGERFKIRVTASFEAVAEVDQVLGDAWYGKRTGQVYPQAGMSVQLMAGETVDLPLGEQMYFLMDRPANERLVLSVRHPRADAGLRSDQPAYRQDDKTGSTYLQLVQSGRFPALEQLISQRQR